MDDFKQQISAILSLFFYLYLMSLNFNQMDVPFCVSNFHPIVIHHASNS